MRTLVKNLDLIALCSALFLGCLILLSCVPAKVNPDEYVFQYSSGCACADRYDLNDYEYGESQ